MLIVIIWIETWFWQLHTVAEEANMDASYIVAATWHSHKAEVKAAAVLVSNSVANSSVRKVAIGFPKSL